jgi:hypothetical protein
MDAGDAIAPAIIAQLRDAAMTPLAAADRAVSRSVTQHQRCARLSVVRAR